MVVVFSDGGVGGLGGVVVVFSDGGVGGVGGVFSWVVVLFC